MKSVLDLTKAITDDDYYREQFSSGADKNILFVEPQLTSKHLYKFILPFFSFYNERVFTAITGLDKYDPYKQIVGIETNLNQKQIKWANYIVFPFTTMDLTKEYGVYQAIREVNPDAKIVFFIDFNFYDMPNDHPHKELFNFPNALESVEKNILLSDLCLSNNLQLYRFIFKKFNNLASTKYADIEEIPVRFACFPYFIDTQIVLQNVDFDFNKPESVINKDIFKKVAEVADELKKEDLDNNKDKAERLENKKPKKNEPKTVKIESKKRGRPKKEENKSEQTEEQESQVAPPENQEIKSEQQQETQSEQTQSEQTQSEQTQSEQTQSEQTSEQPDSIENLPKKLRVGIICSKSSYGDIKSYNQEFQQINDKYGDDITLIFLGYDYDEDESKILDGVNFEYTKQVSIIHYFKQLQGLNLDLVFIPLRKSIFNITSEGINKYLECGVLKIPIMVDDMFPYNQLIVNERNGFLYGGKQNFLIEFDKIVRNPDLIKTVGDGSRKDVIKNYTYTPNNMEVMHSIYS
jgi:hypothetical protein